MKFIVESRSLLDYTYAVACAGGKIITAIDAAIAEIRESGDVYIVKEIRAEDVRSTDDLETALDNMIVGAKAHCDMKNCSLHGWNATFLKYPTRGGDDSRLIFMITVVDPTIFD